MSTMAFQITSLMVVYSTVYSDPYQRKHQRSASLAFVWGVHRDRWIPRTKGQLRRKCFHLMTSSCMHVVVSPVITWGLFTWVELLRRHPLTPFVVAITQWSIGIKCIYYMDGLVGSWIWLLSNHNVFGTTEDFTAGPASRFTPGILCDFFNVSFVQGLCINGNPRWNPCYLTFLHDFWLYDGRATWQSVTGTILFC